jgi:hypothetical protein
VGVNYRPFAQVAFKAEWYRSIPLNRSFIHSDEERPKSAAAPLELVGGRKRIKVDAAVGNEDAARREAVSTWSARSAE